MTLWLTIPTENAGSTPRYGTMLILYESENSDNANGVAGVGVGDRIRDDTDSTKATGNNDNSGVKTTSDDSSNNIVTVASRESNNIATVTSRDTKAINSVAEAVKAWLFVYKHMNS